MRPWLVQLAEEVQDLLRGFAVEVAGRLVGQEDGGVGDQGAGDRHPLVLAAGELVRLVGETVAEADHFERGFGRLFALDFR